MKNSQNITSNHTPIIKQPPIDNRLNSILELVETEPHRSHQPHQQREQHLVRRPLVDDAPRRQAVEETRHAPGEQKTPHIVEPKQLLCHAAGDFLLVKEGGNKGQPDAGDGEVDVEDPSPGDVLGESGADEGACSRVC